MSQHKMYQRVYQQMESECSRRKFLGAVGLATAGVLLNRYTMAGSLFNGGSGKYILGSQQVAVTLGDNYESTFIRQRIQHLFESLGGISDVVQPGDKVGIKINITGGSGWAGHPNLYGVDIRDCAWTHPEVLKAVGELLIDSGVNGNDIFIVEALWDDASYVNFGYADVQSYLGAQRVNLNVPAPYPAFINVSSGPDYFYYDSFMLNRILQDIDVMISIPKMKQHYTAGVTHSMKNLVGITPLNKKAEVMKPYSRDWLHSEGGEADWFHLPRSICDLNMTRPIHLAVIDGVKNAVGGEGPWNPTFQPHEDHYLLAGKNAVSTDSIASLIMGNDPAPAQLLRPDGTWCDNHLWLASQKGMGTNIPGEIELVGDGAGTILDIAEEQTSPESGQKIRLYQNFPNPFRQTTEIKYRLAEASFVMLALFNEKGMEIGRLIHGHQNSGEHSVVWNEENQTPGIYFARLTAGRQSRSIRMQLMN